jgi:hypothetical protein
VPCLADKWITHIEYRPVICTIKAELATQYHFVVLMSAVPPVAACLLRLLAHSEAIRAIRMGKRGSSLAVQLLCMGIWLWCGVMAAPGDEKKGGYGGYGAADEKKGGGYGAAGKAGGKDGYPKGTSIIIRP